MRTLARTADYRCVHCGAVGASSARWNPETRELEPRCTRPCSQARLTEILEGLSTLALSEESERE